MDSNTISGRIVRGVLAGLLAATAGIGLSACQSGSGAPAPEPVVYEDPLIEKERTEQAADRVRDRYAGRPADRIEEELAREQAERPGQYRGLPADRVDEAMARESQP